MRITTTIFCVLTLAMVQYASALDSMDPASIRAAAERAVRTKAGSAASSLTLRVAALDPRLRVAACDVPLNGIIAGSSEVRTQTTVGVHCDGSIRWTVYTTVNVESQTSVFVALRSMPRDTEVGSADFRLETRSVPGIASAYVSDATALDGQRLGRPITSGEPLAFEALAPANLIHRGQHVMLLAHAGGFEVRMSAVALSDGRASQRIKVQNESSQRVIEGIVRSANEVEAPL
jgi:flagella basal body P-ring formation protein FlgA